MKKILVLSLLCLVIISCDNQSSNNDKVSDKVDEETVALFDSEYGFLCDLKQESGISRVFVFDDSESESDGFEFIFYKYIEDEEHKASLSWDHIGIDSLDARLFMYNKNKDGNLISQTGFNESFTQGNILGQTVVFNPNDFTFFISTAEYTFSNGTMMKAQEIKNLAKIDNCTKEENPMYYDFDN